jgi:glycosyltransferase involved in cell wall biosynthesis
MTSIYAAPVTKLLNISFINGMVRSAHENMSITDERRVRGLLTIPFADLVVSNTRAGLKAYRVPHKKRVCIPNGFDLHRLSSLESRNSIRSKLDIRTNHVVGMVASFSEKKDYNAFISTAIKVLENRRDVTFLAIGEGKSRDRIMKMAHGKYADRIRFTGRISNVESVVNVLDIGLLLTNIKNHGEGISNAIMEYMALGKPVIATDYGGNREIVSHGQNGYLVKNNNPESNAFYIRTLIEDQLLAKRMGENSRQIIENKFTMVKMLNAYKSIYVDINKNNKLSKSSN